jgi:hypothetical protein
MDTLVNIQANLNLDADGKIVARDVVVITAVKVKAPASEASRDRANNAPMKSDDAIRRVSYPRKWALWPR